MTRSEQPWRRKTLEKREGLYIHSVSHVHGMVYFSEERFNSKCFFSSNAIGSTRKCEQVSGMLVACLKIAEYYNYYYFLNNLESPDLAAIFKVSSLHMTIKPRDSLGEPPDDLRSAGDSERYISGGAVFSLGDVKNFVGHLNENAFRLATDTAENNLLHDLRWDLKDLCSFVNCLGPHHYRHSMWCYPSGGATIAFPADVYIMGYSRVRRTEWQEQTPWNYLKFSYSARQNRIQIFSIHPEKQKKK
jgi:hypothetical protein